MSLISVIPPYFFFPTITLFDKVLEVFLRRFVADDNIDLTLGKNKICNLIVAATSKALGFKMLLWIDMVHVAPIHQKIIHRNIA